jgi:hypothetical protein
VMIYMAGDNNLTDECVHALTQIKEVDGLKDDICVLAQFDPKGGQLKSHRYHLTPNGKHASLSEDFKTWGRNKHKFKHPDYTEHAWWWKYRSPDVDNRYETNTGSPVTLFDFVAWCVERHPADCYLLVISGHGGGTEKGYLLRDEHPDDALTIWELQVALNAIKDILEVDIDVIGMDSCLMTMAEVSFQLKGLARYLVGSEGYSPIAGWPIKQILERMRNDLAGITHSNPDKRKEEERSAVAKGIVEEYLNYYLDYGIGGLSVDQSALDLDVADTVKKKIDALAIALRNEMPKRAFQRAVVWSHWRAQSYNGEQFVDLYDFCDLLKNEYRGKKVRDACHAVLDTEAAFVPYSGYSGPAFQDSHGVSIYFPWAEIDPNYYAVRFAKRAFTRRRKGSKRRSIQPSEWVAFLKEYILATRRKQRDKGEAYGDNSYPYAARHTEGKHAPGKSMLPQILSMRNPAISAGVSKCILNQAQRKKYLEDLEELTERAAGHPQ